MLRRPGPKLPDDGDLLGALREIYAETDAFMAQWSCDASTDCCRFGVTGREPYVTAIELALLRKGIAGKGGLPKQRQLPMAGERRCPVLTDQGRCAAYAERPLGCRTFFCERAVGPRRPPRDEARTMVQRIAALSERFDPRSPGPRPLSKAF
jgi:hypothetical protein